jgi:hypothetical protein
MLLLVALATRQGYQLEFLSEQRSKQYKILRNTVQNTGNAFKYREKLTNNKLLVIRNKFATRIPQSAIQNAHFQQRVDAHVVWFVQ